MMGSLFQNFMDTPLKMGSLGLKNNLPGALI